LKFLQRRSNWEIFNSLLRLLILQEEQRQAMSEDLRKEVLIGLKQLDAEKSVEFDLAAVRDIKHSGRSRYSPRPKRMD
jgi:hypothetical protein